jgi:hypothetical protein
MTDTDTNTTTADAMLEAHRRRMLDMPARPIFGRPADRSRNSQRTESTSRRHRAINR